jgi:hypothetical protein
LKVICLDLAFHICCAFVDFDELSVLVSLFTLCHTALAPCWNDQDLGFASLQRKPDFGGGMIDSIMSKFFAPPAVSGVDQPIYLSSEGETFCCCALLHFLKIPSFSPQSDWEALFAKSPTFKLDQGMRMIQVLSHLFFAVNGCS